LAIALLGLAAPIGALAQEGPPWKWGQTKHEINLEFLGTRPDAVPIEPFSGGPLTLRLKANEEELLGIGRPTISRFIPAREIIGFLLFADPDGCPSFVDEGWQISHMCALELNLPPLYEDCVNPPGAVTDCAMGGTLLTPWTTDESWVEFTPGLTVPELCTAETCEERPTVLASDPVTPTTIIEVGIGPFLGSIYDGYGWGAHPRLPGLFISADVGPSVKTDQDFNRTGECRNAAGFLNSVAFEPLDDTGQTSLTAHLNIPDLLFSPVVLVDRSVEAGCSDDPDGNPSDDCSIYRIDGGPEVFDDPGIGVLDSMVNELTVTVRAFVLKVTDPDRAAPAELEDWDGDGDCDADDAENLGWELLSGEEILQFTQWHEEYTGIAFDFDANGNVGGVVLPAGPGGTVRPPR
jgi:hypothetical protein